MIAFLALFVILKIYSSWLTTVKTLSTGDWPYLFVENIKEFSWWPKERVFWLTSYYQITAKIFVEYLGFSWEATERFAWFWPFLLLTIFSSYYLTKSWLGVLIYLTNTYILMIVGGGQMGVAMAYALTPLVFAWLIGKNQPLIGGLLLGLQMMFDPRLTLINLVAVVGYYFFVLGAKEPKKLIIPVAVALVLSLFWILPLIKSDQTLMAELGGVEYFSFASFSNTISLLHPNWPENIFGKVYFMRPEFLITAILAFSSLLVLPRNKKVMFFTSLALLGSFLAKGTNPPFGGLYLWLFEHLPGFVVFRDSTKFYLLVAVSYSVLISKFLSKKRTLSFLFLVFWLFTIREALTGQLGGTFKAREVPPEYRQLKDFLASQPGYFATFWLPQKQRFGFSSSVHPAIGGDELFPQEELQESKVKYVIIPYDSEKEIFLEDRKYCEQKRLAIEEKLDKIDFLEKIQDGQIGKIIIYENRSF